MRTPVPLCPARLSRDAAIAAAYGTGETKHEIAKRLGLSGPGVVSGVWGRGIAAGLIEPLPRAMHDYRRRVAQRVGRVTP